MKYCVNVLDIKSENKIWTPSALHLAKTITIPITKETLIDRLHNRENGRKHIDRERDYLLNKFLGIISCSEEEAVYFLKQTNYDVERAVEKYHLEKDPPKPTKKKVDQKTQSRAINEASPILRGGAYFSYNHSFTKPGESDKEGSPKTIVSDFFDFLL
uniref:UBA domain-containing protein n=1 Tax=Arcella intermedia TaxID=1963864 RepID=A0A6B2LL02_9EUKA